MKKISLITMVALFLIGLASCISSIENVQSLSVKEMGKIVYTTEDTNFDKSGFVLDVLMSNGTHYDLSGSSSEISYTAFDNTPGTNSVTMTYKGVNITVSYVVEGLSGAIVIDGTEQLKEAMKNLQDGQILALKPGYYDVWGVSPSRGSDYTVCLAIDKSVTITAYDQTNKPVLYSSRNVNSMGYQQQEILIEANNVTLSNLIVYTTSNRDARNKVIESYAEFGTVIKDCIIDGSKSIIKIGNEYVENKESDPNWYGSPIFMYGVSSSYLIENNELTGSFCFANGSGSLAQTSATLVVRNNKIFEGYIVLNGQRNNGWDNNTIEKLPYFVGNTFNGCFTDTYKVLVDNVWKKVQYNVIIRNCDLNVKKLFSTEDIQEILDNNTFIIEGNINSSIVTHGDLENDSYNNNGISSTNYSIVYIGEPVEIGNWE